MEATGVAKIAYYSGGRARLRIRANVAATVHGLAAIAMSPTLQCEGCLEGSEMSK